MKKLLLCLVLFIYVLGAYAQNKSEIYYAYTSENFQAGDKAHFFGDNVRLRSKPTTASEVIKMYKIGTEVEILKVDKTKGTFDGIERSWYKVRCEGKEGYVLGGLLAIDRVKAGVYTYLIAYKKKGDQLMLKTRLLEEGKKYKEREDRLYAMAFNIEAYKSRGLDDVKSVFHINYSAEACGANGGGMYFFYDGQEMHKAIEYSAVSEAGLFYVEEQYTFPNEKGGVEGKLVYKKEKEEVMDEETNHTETIIIEREVEWKNNKIVPEIK